MSFVDVLIPLTAGILLVGFPRLFTKSTGEQFLKTSKRLRSWGFLLLGVAALYVLIRLLEGLGI
jgi:hypothetical protein